MGPKTQTVRGTGTPPVSLTGQTDQVDWRTRLRVLGNERAPPLLLGPSSCVSGAVRRGWSCAGVRPHTGRGTLSRKG